MKYIITSDWHLRPDRPLCRTDIDWMETQRKNVAEVFELAEKHNAAVINAGDIFDAPRMPPNVITMLLQEVTRHMCLIGGNHSIQYHKQEFLMESSLGILACMRDENLVYLPCEDNSEDGRFEQVAKLPEPMGSILMAHTLTVKSSSDIMFGMKAISAQKLLDKYPDYRYIVTGDNHTAFIYEDDNRYVINPGCLNIQSASHKDYEPCVYLLDTDKDTIKQIKLTPYHDCVTDDHLKEKRERDDRIAAFVETVKKGGKVKLSFDENLEEAVTGQDDDVLAIYEELKGE